MKTLIPLATAIVIAVSVAYSPAEEHLIVAGSSLLGDASCDGVVDSNDAAFVLRLSARLLANLPCPENADVSADGSINSVDSALILQFAAGFLESLGPSPTSTPANTIDLATNTSVPPTVTPEVPPDATVPPTSSPVATDPSTMTTDTPTVATASPTPTYTRTPTAEPTLMGVHAQLAALMDSIEDRTFHVVLERTAPAEIAGNRIEIFNAPMGTRVDTIPAGEKAAVTSLIEDTDAGTVVSCQDGPANWHCSVVESFGQSVLRTAIPFTFFPASELGMYEVSEIEGRLLAGQEARCFRIETPDGDIVEYCFTQAGVPVYSSPIFGTYEAIEISDEVPAGAFDPPVPVE